MPRVDPHRLRLIGITDREALGMGGLVTACRAAMEVGLPALILREKDLPEEQILPIAEELRFAAIKHGTLVILNRRIEIARAVGADGVHLGADGPTIAEARAALGDAAIIGYSAHSESEALDAFKAGADYVTFSPVFETPSKRDFLAPVGLERLAALATSAPGPVIALGGINAENLAQVKTTGVAGAALIRPIFASASPGDAVRTLLKVWDGE